MKFNLYFPVNCRGVVGVSRGSVDSRSVFCPSPILCLLNIHFSLWTKMLKVTLPLLTSVFTLNIYMNTMLNVFFFDQAKSKQ